MKNANDAQAREGCNNCRSHLYVGLKCKNCGRVSELQAQAGEPEAVVWSEPKRGHCQNGRGDICLAGNKDGVCCPPDSCDIDDGMRPDPRRTQPTAHQALNPLTFEQAWAVYEARGYRYGKDALEQVRFGWNIAHGINSLTQQGPT